MYEITYSCLQSTAACNSNDGQPLRLKQSVCPTNDGRIGMWEPSIAKRMLGMLHIFSNSEAISSHSSKSGTLIHTGIKTSMILEQTRLTILQTVDL